MILPLSFAFQRKQGRKIIFAKRIFRTQIKVIELITGRGILIESLAFFSQKICFLVDTYNWGSYKVWKQIHNQFKFILGKFSDWKISHESISDSLPYTRVSYISCNCHHLNIDILCILKMFRMRKSCLLKNKQLRCVHLWVFKHQMN